MEKQELLIRLHQIEEQASLTLEELPKHLAKERLRMIISLAKHMRSEVSAAVSMSRAAPGRADDEGNTPDPRAA